MREIGGEFWDVPTNNIKNKVFPESTQWFLSGRIALQAIIKEMSWAKTVAMPSWCCDSIVRPFVDAGMEVHFYPFYSKKGLIQELNLDSDVLFIMDYFGYSSKQSDYRGYEGIVIRDVTHSILSNYGLDADYSFGSLRKWCGMWTGGYAWTKDNHSLVMEDSDDGGYVALRKKAMQLKHDYINDCGINDKEYLKIFDEAEQCLDSVGIARADEQDVWMARRLDVGSIRRRRRANAEILMDAFSEWLIFPEMNEGDCPLFVPVIVPDSKRNELKRHLVQREIYCPIHWPVSEYHRLDERAEAIYNDELSLVCDQRYDEEDMYRMVEEINRFWKAV